MTDARASRTAMSASRYVDRWFSKCDGGGSIIGVDAIADGEPGEVGESPCFVMDRDPAECSVPAALDLRPVGGMLGVSPEQ
jgi:hypothetical protein